MPPRPMEPLSNLEVAINKFTFLEFFAGGGMARAGLGSRWKCLLANDFDPKKAAIYEQNWGSENLHVGEVAKLDLSYLRRYPEADLAWASFPCQDLSLAGAQAGLCGHRSGAFWSFWSQIVKLTAMDRNPRTIVLENVCGALTSNSGRDFASLLDTLREGGYRAGALVIDAVNFVPHSRPRLFIVAVRNDVAVPQKLQMEAPLSFWTPVGLSSALQNRDLLARADWISWRLPLPPRRPQNFPDLIDDHPDGVQWHTPAETRTLLEMMSPVNKAKIRKAQLAGRKLVGTLYKRTRPDESGIRRQRAEVRFDDIAGCLRTPGGGSSRQTIIVIDGPNVRSRLLAPREAARLMGLSEDYILPKNYNDAYHLAGDGVVVPVVKHLSEYLLEPLLREHMAGNRMVA